MLGERVSHIRFGEGRVTAFDPPRIEITFASGEVKTFAYPRSVERFIRFAGDEARQRALLDREQAEVLERESIEARLAEDRRRAEEAAQKRLEMLHDKKVAAARRSAERSAAARKKKMTGGTQA